jgi:teichuronic acid exporter
MNLSQPFIRMPGLDMKGMLSFFAFGTYVTLSRITWYFYSRADALIIGKVLGKEILGFYSVGLLLATLPMEKISDIINQVAFPAFSSVQSQSGLAGQHFLKAVRVMSFFAFPILWGISSIAPEIIQIFLGSRWGAAAVPMQVIAIVIPVRMISNLLNPAVLGVGRPDISFYNSFVAFMIMPAAFLVGSMWGLLGVSLAWAVVFPIVFCINLSRVVRVLEIRFIDVFAAMRLPFTASVFMYGCVLFVKYASIMDVQIIPKVAALVACGALAYGVMTFIFNRKGLKEVRELVNV